MPFLKEKIELSVEEAELKAQQALVVFTPVQRFIIVFCIVAVIPAYFVVRTVSYKIFYSANKDKKITATPSFSNPAIPEISKTIVTQTGQDTYSVAAQIENKNVDLSLDNVQYTIVLLDSSGAQIYSSTANLFLLPGEKKYLIVPKVTSSQKIASARIELPNDLPWKKRLSIPKIELDAPTPAVFNQVSPPALTVQGTVYNNSPYQLNKVDIGFFLYDAKGNVIGISQRSEFTVKPFERRAYVQLWPNVFSNDVATVDVVPQTDVLNSQNISLPKELDAGSGNLGR